MIVVSDVEDYRPDVEQPHLDVVHRPKADTPIKNGPRGERRIGISAEVCAVVDDYLKHQRPDVMDEHGREPLLATSQGRVATSTIRRYVYKWSRPCAIGQECPHDRDSDECEAVDVDQASSCPSSVTPHPIRRGYITHLLQAGVPVDVVSDRCNVSPKVIDRHYDVGLLGRENGAGRRVPLHEFVVDAGDVLRRGLLEQELGDQYLEGRSVRIAPR